MLWPNTHTRTRKRLSPYIDGQVSPRERTAVEAHLAACDACRRELDELRAAISIIGRLAEVEPTRSFALTPRMLEGRAGAPPAVASPLANGMRLAGAGVAFVLAVVLIGDFASMSGGSGGSDDSGTLGSAEIQMSDLDNGDAPTPYAAPAATGAMEGDAFAGEDRAAPEELSSAADTAETCPPAAAGARENEQGTEAGGAGGAGGPVTAATPAPEPAPTTLRVPPSEDVGSTVECAPAAAGNAPVEASPVVANPLRDADEGGMAATTASATDDDGGVSTLTVIEIILAGGLVALIGAIAIEYVLRRRAV